MRKVILSLMLLMMIAVVSADCELDVSMINQDPYPAVPGDYVKLVFQIDGISNSDCGDITFNLPADYPIKFDPGKNGLRTFKKVDYIKDYESSILVPYEVRVDENALDGTNPIEVNLKNSKDLGAVSKSFNLEVENSIADFEVYIKNYDYKTKELTLEILNVADSDVQALTVEIPKQDGLSIKGANKIVVGDLDSNEYTTADFNAIMNGDGEIKLDLIYSDSINVRRTIEKTVQFDSSYFTGIPGEETSGNSTTYIILAAIALIIVWIVYRKIKKSKRKKNKQ